MKKILYLFSLIIMITACDKDVEPEQQEQETLSEYHEIVNCELKFPEGTNTSAFGNATFLTAGDYKVMNLNSSTNNLNFSNRITVGKLSVTIGNVLDENNQPIAYSVYIPDENNPIMFNATETAIAIVFMHPFLHDFDIETARTIKNKIRQSPNFISLVGEVAERMQNGHLNISGQDFDPASFDNYIPIVSYLINDTYDNSTVNQDGIKIVDINQNNEFITFKIENYRKRWLKVIPSLFTNGNTSISSFYSETANVYYPHAYVGSININLLKQFFTNPDLTDLHNTSIQFKVRKENAEQLYINIYGNGLDEYGNIPQQLLDNHLDAVIISTYQDFVLPIFEMITGINNLKETLGDQEKILVGRPNNDPYSKFLERMLIYVGTNAFKVEYKNLIDDDKPVLAIKLTISKAIKFILDDIGNHPQDFYKILKDKFGDEVIKQNKELFKNALNGYNILNSSLSFLSSGANMLAFANTVIYSDWHNQKRIDLTYDNSPTMQTDPVITNITSSSATASGNIVDNNGSDVLESGICWSTTIVPPPSIADEHTTDGQPSGLYSSNITGLTPSTTYYIRAYARNGNGIGYGEVVSFDTSEPETAPTVITTSISNITSTTATSGGNITDDGGSAIIAKGICWSTTPNPTTSDNTTDDGTGIGSFTSSLTGLTENTTYYVRAYATNSEGTAYGYEEQFTTETCSGGIYSGSIVLQTQSEIDNFGSNCYSEVTGTLKISSGSDIVSLIPLSTITSVDCLSIVGCNNLIDLEGLSLNSIYSKIELLYNDNLININSLNGITTCNEISIEFNNSLVNINGLSNISGAMSGKLRIRDNNALTNIDALSGINIVGNEIVITTNPLLNNINGLSNITSQGSNGGNLVISANNSIASLDGLLNITSVYGNIYFNDNINLTDFCGIRPYLLLGAFSGTYNVSGNAYNPTQQDIIDNNCSQ